MNDLIWDNVPDVHQIMITFSEEERLVIAKGHLPERLHHHGLRKYLNASPGFFLLRTQINDAHENVQRKIYAECCRRIGALNERYGAFYDVKDYGGDYINSRIPISQTHDTTGFHTDSSAAGYYPKAVGLLCIRPALLGGQSLLVNAANAYHHLIGKVQQYESLLAFPAIRDIVTPGTEFSLANLKQNRFPILEKSASQFVFRYMRYWLERGHLKASEPLPDSYTEMLDDLDRFLNDTENQFSILLEAGDILIFNNTFLLHNRTAFENAPEIERERIMVRAWMDY
jgi:hypothetical protein